MKFSKLIFILCIWGLCSSINACGKLKDNPRFIKLENNSHGIIHVDFQYNYPDTIILDRALVDHIDTIGPNKSIKVPTASKNRRWANHINDSNPQNVLMVFVYSLDTLKKYSWEEIQDDYKVLKRYDLTVNQIKQMDWTVTYP